MSSSPIRLPLPSNDSSEGTPPDSPEPNACQPSESSNVSDEDDMERQESESEDEEEEEEEDSDADDDEEEEEHEDEVETWAAIEKKRKRAEAKKRNRKTAAFFMQLEKDDKASKLDGFSNSPPAKKKKKAAEEEEVDSEMTKKKIDVSDGPSNVAPPILVPWLVVHLGVKYQIGSL